jgi:hypothetical protein
LIACSRIVALISKSSAPSNPPTLQRKPCFGRAFFASKNDIAVFVFSHFFGLTVAMAADEPRPRIGWVLGDGARYAASNGILLPYLPGEKA